MGFEPDQATNLPWAFRSAPTFEINNDVKVRKRKLSFKLKSWCEKSEKNVFMDFLSNAIFRCTKLSVFFLRGIGNLPPDQWFSSCVVVDVEFFWFQSFRALQLLHLRLFLLKRNENGRKLARNLCRFLSETNAVSDNHCLIFFYLFFKRVGGFIVCWRRVAASFHFIFLQVVRQ